MNASAKEALSFALSLADVARSIALRYFRTSLDATRKADGSPVTVADLAIESELKQRISERFPSHGIIGEETGGARGRRYTWILDPIDGTRSFISGCPLFGTLIGLLDDGKPLFGLIDIPATAERWVGDGRHTWLNDGAARASGCASLALARLYSTSRDGFAPGDRKRLDRLRSKVAITCYDGDCYAYGLLASGHCDVVIDFGLEPFDYLPLVGVITGAGGAITDWDARPLNLDSDGRVIAAASEKLLKDALQTLKRSS